MKLESGTQPKLCGGGSGGVGSRQITTNNFLILLFDRKSGGVIKSKDKPTDVQQLTRLGQAARLVTTKVNL